MCSRGSCASFKEATLHHERWETDELAGILEDLLREYGKSIGGGTTGPADATPSVDHSAGLEIKVYVSWSSNSLRSFDRKVSPSESKCFRVIPTFAIS